MVLPGASCIMHRPSPSIDHASPACPTFVGCRVIECLVNQMPDARAAPSMPSLPSGKRVQWPTDQCCRLAMRFTFVRMGAVHAKVACVNSLLPRKAPEGVLMLTLPHPLADCPASASCLLCSPLHASIRVSESCLAFLSSAVVSYRMLRSDMYLRREG